MGKNMQVKRGADMSKAQQTAACNMMALARETLSQALKTPSSAVKLFHPTRNLFKDWDTFNLRDQPQQMEPLLGKRACREVEKPKSISSTQESSCSASLSKRRQSSSAGSTSGALTFSEADVEERLCSVKRDAKEERRLLLEDANASAGIVELRMVALEQEVKASKVSMKDVLARLEVNNILCYRNQVNSCTGKPK